MFEDILTIVILSEAKDLLSSSCENQVLRFAQDDNARQVLKAKG